MIRASASSQVDHATGAPGGAPSFLGLSAAGVGVPAQGAERLLLPRRGGRELPAAICAGCDGRSGEELTSRSRPA